jgi:hypothetical protein
MKDFWSKAVRTVTVRDENAGARRRAEEKLLGT